MWFETHVPLTFMIAKHFVQIVHFILTHSMAYNEINFWFKHEATNVNRKRENRQPSTYKHTHTATSNDIMQNESDSINGSIENGYEKSLFIYSEEKNEIHSKWIYLYSISLKLSFGSFSVEFRWVRMLELWTVNDFLMWFDMISRLNCRNSMKTNLSQSCGIWSVFCSELDEEI